MFAGCADACESMRVLPRFEMLDRLRPVDLISPGQVRVDLGWAPGCAPASVWVDNPAVAPYVALVLEFDRAEVAGRLEFGWRAADGSRLLGWYDGGRRMLGIDVVDADGKTSRHRRRRLGRPDGGVDSAALALTSTHLTVFTGQRGNWTARGRVKLSETIEIRDETFLTGLSAGFEWQPRDHDPAPIARLQAGAFGQLGLRDLHVATYADGGVFHSDGRIVLTATHAGPGFFETGHTGVWTFDPRTRELVHQASLYFRRPDGPGVYGDHATHLVRDGDDWLVATSTWGDFDGTGVSINLARTTADLLSGEHVLDTAVLAVPSTGVGVWDPHLARIDGAWHVGYVTATKFFAFHPALCRGVTLDRLELVGEDRSRTATEGIVLSEIDGAWRLLASDGPANPRGVRQRFPVYDLTMSEVGVLDAPYPTNIPWPMIVPDGDNWLMLTFDGTTYGGDILGYGTHGDVIVMRSVPSDRATETAGGASKGGAWPEPRPL